MLTSIATAVAQNVILGWLWRRAQEIASLAGIFVPIYLAMPDSMKQDVHAIFSGQGGGLTISAAVGIVWYLWTQWQSYRATVRPQVVTADGQKITPVPTSVAMERVEAQAKAAPKATTLWERITGQS